jgi:hypothetical protein
MANVEGIDLVVEDAVLSGKSFDRIMNGTTSEVVLYEKGIEAGLLGSNGRAVSKFQCAALSPTASPGSSTVTFRLKFGPSLSASLTINLFNGGGDEDYANAVKSFMLLAALSAKGSSAQIGHLRIKVPWALTLTGTPVLVGRAGGTEAAGSDAIKLQVTGQLNQAAHDAGITIFVKHVATERFS